MDSWHRVNTVGVLQEYCEVTMASRVYHDIVGLPWHCKVITDEKTLLSLPSKHQGLLYKLYWPFVHQN